MSVQGQIYLDGNWYFYARGSYAESSAKVFSESFSMDSRKLRQEGGMNPTNWDMTIICFSQNELVALSGSFIKVTPDSRLAFSGRRLDQHMVYFDSFGPVSTLDRTGNSIFSVPIRLSAADIGQ